MPRIKKYRNNEYLFVDNHWVRNYTRTGCQQIDINRWTQTEDYKRFLNHELANGIGITNIDIEKFSHRKIVIVSDGMGFDETHRVLNQLNPKEVCVIGVNKALAKWQLVGDNCPANERRTMQYYLTNNPYPEALTYLPNKHNYWPKCILSARTYPPFVRQYKGIKHKYYPTPEVHYSATKPNCHYFVDDYRNPVCAAIYLAYRFGVNKLFLLSCDNVFDEERNGTVQLTNGKWIYPQQQLAHNIIDGCLYWLRTVGVNITWHSQGPNYENGVYINLDLVKDFFND